MAPLENDLGQKFGAKRCNIKNGTHDTDCGQKLGVKGCKKKMALHKTDCGQKDRSKKV